MKHALSFFVLVLGVLVGGIIGIWYGISMDRNADHVVLAKSQLNCKKIKKSTLCRLK